MREVAGREPATARTIGDRHDRARKGGFGNLIALPLQHMPRGHGNSVFLNADFDPHPDQWTLLSCVRRMAFAEVETAVREVERSGDIIGVRRSVTDDEQTDDPWTLPPSRKKMDEPITGPLPAKVRVVRGSERLATFLNLPVKSIGQIGGGRRRPIGLVDVAVIQTLNRKQVVDDVVANYGHVIVDECHHISAVGFEQVLRRVKARYITGLAATPQRKDGHHPIMVMQCGPIRHRGNAKEQALARPFKHFVFPRPTIFRLQPSTEKPEMHELYAALAGNKARNDLMCVKSSFTITWTTACRCFPRCIPSACAATRR